jgi:CRISPR-associated endonuclease Cas1
LPNLAKFALALAIIVGVPPLSRRLRLPAVVGLLLSGILIGPQVLGFAGERTPIADFFAELGKLLLMFFAGLEIDLALFRQARRKAITFGLFTTGIPLLLGTAVGLSFGYGIAICVDRGHLVLKDGIGGYRREGRFPRVGHGIRRLVVIGSDGFVSLAALRWLADQDASFIMLERDGSVLATTGPVRPSDSRLRRAQSLAGQSGVALQISRELITQKLAGQERVANDLLHDLQAARIIASARDALTTAETIPAIRLLEAQAALVYWSAWRAAPVMYPKNDLRRVPDHWRTFGTRVSPLTGSPRLAVNPPNAILNYLYALLESETRLAAAAMGLDPGIGILHVDTDARDSLACDLMEPIRPQVDAYLLDWLLREPLRREWFFEQRDGNCRLIGSFAVRLSETAQTWGRAVAPIAEWVSRELWFTIAKPSRKVGPPTRLTESSRREAKGSSFHTQPPPKPPRICLGCGAPITYGRGFCSSCGVIVARDELIKSAKRGRIAAQSPEAQARRTETQRRNANAQLTWEKSSQPKISDEVYRNEIQPRLAGVTIPTIMSALNVCASYAADIRRGRRRPHPRHWEKLFQLT